MTQDYISIIKNENNIDVLAVRWDRENNFFTLETFCPFSYDNDVVVIYKDCINNLKDELEKLQELLQELMDDDSKPGLSR